MSTTNNLTTDNPLVGELTPGRLGENTGTLPGGTHSTTHHASTSTGTGASGRPTSTHTSTAPGGGSDMTSQTSRTHTPSVNGTSTQGTHGSSTPGLGAGTGAATGAGLGTAAHDGTSRDSEAPDFGRSSGVGGQASDGSHLVPGLEHIGTGYSGPHTKRGDITAPTGSLPQGLVEKGATNQPIPRPSPKDFFKMSNAGTPSPPQALANRPVAQDPISEADRLPPTHGGHSGIPGNMKTSGVEVRQEGVDPYAASSHGDHLAHGVDAGTGYAGATAARGDTTAPTGSLPAGTIEAGAQNRAIPRPSAKDQFLINNSASPSNPVSLAKRMFRSAVGTGGAKEDEVKK